MSYFIGFMLIVLSVQLAATYSRLAMISEVFEHIRIREVSADDLDDDYDDGNDKPD